MLWSIDSCQTRVSADHHHMTVSRAHFWSDRVCVYNLKLTADVTSFPLITGSTSSWFLCNGYKLIVWSKLYIYYFVDTKDNLGFLILIQYVRFKTVLSFVFSRWRLQSAFYTHASVGRSGFRGIGIEDIFLVTNWSTSHRNRLNDNDFGPLTLRDLKGIKPEYLSNIVVNEWIINETGDNQEKYELLIMSPTKIERLDRPEGQEQFENKLDPGDIDLSAAMATSAAAVARHMGAYNQSAEGFKQLQTVLGLGMGSSTVSDNEALKRENGALRVSAFTLKDLKLCLYFCIFWSRQYQTIVVIVIIIIIIVIIKLNILLTIFNTGKRNTGLVRLISRRLIFC